METQREQNLHLMRYENDISGELGDPENRIDEAHWPIIYSTKMKTEKHHVCNPEHRNDSHTYRSTFKQQQPELVVSSSALIAFLNYI